MTCDHCGTDLPESAIFCGECGSSVVVRLHPDPVVAEAPEDKLDLDRLAPPEWPRLADVDVGSDADADEHHVEPEPVPEEAPVSEEWPPPVLDGDDDGDPVLQCPACDSELAASDLYCVDCGFVPDLSRLGAADTAAIEPLPAAGPSPGVTGVEPAGLPLDELQAVVGGPLESDAQPAEESAEDGPSEVDPEPSEIDAEPPPVALARGERYVLKFSTGESVAVNGTGLVGRRPGGEPGEFFDHLIPVLDTTKSVSKTHLEFGQYDGRLWITDRYSTNGTILSRHAGEPMRCEPGRRYLLDRGARVDLGDQFFVVN